MRIHADPDPQPWPKKTFEKLKNRKVAYFPNLLMTIFCKNRRVESGSEVVIKIKEESFFLLNFGYFLLFFRFYLAVQRGLAVGPDKVCKFDIFVLCQDF